MAEVYRKVKSGMGAGREIQQAMGLVRVVQDRLELEATEGGYRAEANLAIHRNSGNSQIKVEHGKIDWYVVLDDERGLKAAMSIEYGRKAAKATADILAGKIDGSLVNDVGSEGLFVLHDAMKLSRGGGMSGIETGAGFDE